VLLYEAAMVSILRHEEGDQVLTSTNLAHKGLLRFFDAMGIEISGWFLPGLALVAVLLAWQVIGRFAWTVDVRYLGLMLVESILLALPLVVFGRLLRELGSGAGALLAPAATEFAHAGPLWRVAMSIGAGLYEELVFRMLVIALLHAVLVDVAKLSGRTGTGIAIAISALLFMMYHWLGGAPGSVSLVDNLFYFAAGLYFGLIFVLRGFGIVAAAHALYDIAVVVALPAVIQ
jgi:membrane protease YdiL (CAAX protease family)